MTLGRCTHAGCWQPCISHRRAWLEPWVTVLRVSALVYYPCRYLCNTDFEASCCNLSNLFHFLFVIPQLAHFTFSSLFSHILDTVANSVAYSCANNPRSDIDTFSVAAVIHNLDKISLASHPAKLQANLDTHVGKEERRAAESVDVVVSKVRMNYKPKFWRQRY